MKWVPEESPLVRLLLFAFTPLVIGALILARLAPDFLLAAAHCPLRELTGVPCPTCGGTLAATRLAGGQLVSALSANPLVAVLIVVYFAGAVWAIITTLLPRLRRGLGLSRREKRTAGRLAVLLLVLNWVWLLTRYLG